MSQKRAPSVRSRGIAAHDVLDPHNAVTWRGAGLGTAFARSLQSRGSKPVRFAS